MISVILAAGSGTRMRPISYYLPKILLPVHGRPVLNYILDNLANLDITTNYIVASEHLEIIEKFLTKTNAKNIKVVRGLGWETGGDISIALEQIDTDDDIAVMNGDIITDVSMYELYQNHIKFRSMATIAMFEIDNINEAKRFGSIVTDDKLNILEFKEKSIIQNKPPFQVNTGFYIFDHKLIEQRSRYLIPSKFKLETDLFPKLAKEGNLRASLSKINYWWDVGTMESYLQAENYMINNKGVVSP